MRKKHYLELILAAVLVISGFAGIKFINKPVELPKENKEITFTAEAEDNPEDPQSVNVISPDEKLTLTMTSTPLTGGIINQIFTITNNSDQRVNQIFEREGEPGNEISIPFNTFAPTNRYIFLKINKPVPEYIVLRTDGKEIKPGQQYVELVSLFKEKYPDFEVTDVTGWGGYSVIIVNTNKENGDTGPSWWFDVPSSNFIRLSTRFN